MNNPTQITLSNSLVNNQSAPSTSDELVQLPEQVLAAKNIQFSKSKIHVDEVHIEASAEISDS